MGVYTLPAPKVKVLSKEKRVLVIKGEDIEMH
jgi:hypothetical protein